MKKGKVSKLLKISCVSAISFILFTMLFALPVSANDKVTVMVDGAVLNFDVEPEIVNGRTMVPFRLIFEALGAQINYNAQTQEVTATRIYDGNPENVETHKHVMPAYVKLQIGNNYMETVIDKELTSYWLDAAPYIKNGRTLVPVRAISESFGADVLWDAETKTVNIFSNLYIEAPARYVNGGHLQMMLCDSFTYYNGNLYFTFSKANWKWGGTEFVWDGEQTYEGKIAPFSNIITIDKVNNKVIYFVEGTTQKTKDTYFESIDYYTANFDGADKERIATHECTDYIKEDKYEEAIIIYSHPEWWGLADSETGEIIHTFTEPGTYDVTDKWLQFLPDDSDDYTNSKQFEQQYTATIDNNTLFYTSALNGETLGIELPMAWPQHKYADIMLKTPRYIFVRTIAHEHDIDVPPESREAFFTGLYAVDRFENKLYTLRTQSSEGPYLTLEEFNNTPPTGGGGGTTTTGGGGKTCAVCHGAGSKTCNVCHGAGKTKSYIGGEHYKNCSGCNGRGSKRCTTCGGDGRVQDDPRYQ